MKSLILTLMIALSSLAINAQTVSATFSPHKNGWGTTYEHPLYKNLSIVGSYERGAYKYEDREGNKDRVRVVKFGSGLKYDWFSVMYLHNNFIHGDLSTDGFKISRLHKNSIEVGASGPLKGNFGFTLHYDVMNFELRMGLSYVFKKAP